MSFWYLYDGLSLLLLVFIGFFFARQYGGLSFLVLLGFLLPTVIFGRYGVWNEATPFYLVSLAVVVYRFVVALVAPIWLVRAASRPGRQRAGRHSRCHRVSFARYLLILLTTLAAAGQNGYRPTLLDVALSVWSQVIIAAGLGLAVALYLPKVSGQATIAPPPLAAKIE